MKKKINLLPRKLFVKTGDIVKIITGDDKGKTGKVIEINSKTERIKVEGIKMQTHFIKAKSKQEAGSIQKKEGFFHISNVKVEESKEFDKDAYNAKLKKQEAK